MSETMTVRPLDRDHQTPPRRARWWVAIAAAVAALVAIGALLFAAAQEPELPVADDAEVEAVTAALAAFSAGDLDAWLAAFSDEAVMFTQPIAADPAGVRVTQAFFIALGQQLDVTCATTGISVRCEGTVTDSLSSGAGIRPGDVILTATVADGEITRLAWSGSNPAKLIADVADWIAVARPDYWERHFVECLTESTCHRRVGVAHFLMTREAAEALVAIVPEFLAASDDYPPGG